MHRPDGMLTDRAGRQRTDREPPSTRPRVLFATGDTKPALRSVPPGTLKLAPPSRSDTRYGTRRGRARRTPTLVYRPAADEHLAVAAADRLDRRRETLVRRWVAPLSHPGRHHGVGAALMGLWRHSPITVGFVRIVHRWLRNAGRIGTAGPPAGSATRRRRDRAGLPRRGSRATAYLQ